MRRGANDDRHLSPGHVLGAGTAPYRQMMVSLEKKNKKPKTGLILAEKTPVFEECKCSPPHFFWRWLQFWRPYFHPGSLWRCNNCFAVWKVERKNRSIFREDYEDRWVRVGPHEWIDAGGSE